MPELAHADLAGEAEAELQSTVELAQAINLSPAISQEVIRLVDAALNKPGNSNTFDALMPQVAPEVKEWLVHELPLLRDNPMLAPELQSFLLALTTKTKPDDQRKLLERCRPILENPEHALQTVASLAFLDFAESVRKGSVELDHRFLDFVIMLQKQPAPIQEKFADIPALFVEGIITESSNGEYSKSQMEQLVTLYLARSTPEHRQISLPLMAHMVTNEPMRFSSFIQKIPVDEQLLYRDFIIEKMQQALTNGQNIFNGSHLETFASLHADLQQALATEFANYLEQGLAHAAKAQFATYILKHLSREERVKYQSQIDDIVNNSTGGQLLVYAAELTEEERRQMAPRLRKVLEDRVMQRWGSVMTGLRFWFALSEYEKVVTFRGLTNFLDQNDRIDQQTTYDQLDFFESLPPDERSRRLPKMSRYLESLSGTSTVGGLISFLQRRTPEERRSLRPAVEHTFRMVLSSEVGEFNQRQSRLISYFSGLPEDEQPSLADPIAARLLSKINSEIGDLGLRKKYRESLSTFVFDPNASLVGLNEVAAPRDHTSLMLGLKKLGLDPLPAMSWELTSEQEQEMLYKLAAIAEKAPPGLLHGLDLPYRPREGSEADFEELVVGWLRKLDFLISMQKNFGADAILERHINRLHEIQAVYARAYATREVPLGLLKASVREVQQVGTEVKDLFAKLIELEQLSTADFEKFVQSWNGEVESIFVLGTRMREVYPEIIPFLQGLVQSSLDGTFHKKRYDLENPLTAEQLSPLLAKVPAEQHEAAIGLYRQGVAFTHTEERQAEAPKSKDAGYALPAHLRTQHHTNLLSHGHLRGELLKSPAFQQLDETDVAALEEFVAYGLLEPKQKEAALLTNPSDFMRRFGKLLDAQAGKLIIQIHQLYKDLTSASKTPDVLAHTLERLLKQLPDDLQQMAFFSQDLKQSIGAELAQQIVPKESRSQKRILLTHTSDHPKTLIEIGKYPVDSGACQSYEYSNVNLPRTLVGYVRDSHIQAVVTRVLAIDEEPQAIVAIDEAQGRATVQLADGTKQEVTMSKPIARAMAFLGQVTQATDGSKDPVFVDQPIYLQPGAIDGALAESLVHTALEKWSLKLREALPVTVRPRAATDQSIKIAGSHNRIGHYNDRLGTGNGAAEAGHDGKAYTVEFAIDTEPD